MMTRGKQDSKLVWKRTNGISGNEVLQGNGFYISYMPPGGMNAFSFFASDEGSEETALCIRRGKDVEYLILNGDYRNEYSKVVAKGLKACKAVFEKHKANNESSWSGK